MKNSFFLVLALFFTAVFVHAEGFRAGPAITGETLCFPQDVSGRIYGNAVSDYYCTQSYRAAVDIYGKISRCFAADKYNVVFGKSVSDSYCSVGFKTALSITGLRYCYNHDRFGKVYGQPVHYSYCN
jgi:hypothetical protein